MRPFVRIRILTWLPTHMRIKGVSFVLRDSRPAEYTSRYTGRFSRWALIIGALGGAGGAFLYRWRSHGVTGFSFPSVFAHEGSKAGKEEVADQAVRRISQRELRYQEFASLEYGGEVYMTARDFLESVTQDTPRGHELLTFDDKMLTKKMKATPPFSKGSHTLLRDMWNDGVFTYADYLFLLTALIKPRRQFEIVFKMIDVDGSDSVDVNEFTTMLKAVTKQRQNPLITQNKLEHSSLTVHLFGMSGKRKISSRDLFKFIDDLQTEVRQMEFNHHSMGAPTISSEQFATILLRHTQHDVQNVVQRLHSRPVPPTEGITFSQFNDFCLLLNALDDFAIAMTMYTIAGKPITEEEFGRASQVCLGKRLDDHLVHCVFQIFDLDGDGKLSQREFLSVMKNWRLRGMKVRETQTLGTIDKFKRCFHMEMKNQ